MSVINTEELMRRLDQYILDLEEEKTITLAARETAGGCDTAYHSGEAVAFTSAIHMMKAVLREFK